MGIVWLVGWMPDGYAETDVLTLARSVVPARLNLVAAIEQPIEDPEAFLGPIDEPTSFAMEAKGVASSVKEMHLLKAYNGFLGVGLLEYQLNQNESQVLGLDDQSDLVIFGAMDRKEGVLTRFTPPKPLLIKGEAGAVRHMIVKVEVLDLHNPQKHLHDGQLEVNTVYRGAIGVELPSGHLDAVLMESVASGKIGPASIDDRQYRLFAEDKGLVASREILKVSAFMVYNKTLDEFRLQRIDQPR